MFRVHANPDKNRLYVTLEGHLEPSERKQAAQAVISAIGQLRHGYDIVNWRFEEVATLEEADALLDALGPTPEEE